MVCGGVDKHLFVEFWGSHNLSLHIILKPISFVSMLVLHLFLIFFLKKWKWKWLLYDHFLLVTTFESASKWARIQFMWRGNLWKNRDFFFETHQKTHPKSYCIAKKPYIRRINTHLSNLCLAVKSRCLFLKWTP